MSILLQQLPVDWSTLRPLLISVGIFYLVYHIFRWLLSLYNYAQIINKIPGPEFSTSPLGHLYMFKPTGKMDQVASFFNAISGLAKAYEPKHSLIRLWLAVRPMIVIYKADAAERIFSSNKHIQKAQEYKLLNPWLGTGLLTSWGQKWFQRRKMITPAFHFNILEAFLPGMNEQATVLVDKLQEKIDESGNSRSAIIDVCPYLTYAALDVICETAMGVKIGSQSNPNNDYVYAIHRVGNKIVDRYLKPWLWNDTFYFNFTANGRQDKRDLKVLHDFTMKVIQDRKRETMANPEKLLYQQNNNTNTEDQFSTKRRLAFLDMLIEQHLKDPTSLTELDMREEVDTFMFEGHDTTTVSMIWTLFMIGHHPDIQERVHQEIDEIWERDQVDNTRFLTSKHIREMKFLEACIKESLRLFPSVPYIGRVAAEDIQYDNYIVPKDSTLILFISLIQRDSKIFNNPDSFIPDRFLEGSDHYVKNPFAYVPFSAGPRNCIGQKFALQEEKIILATLLRHFRLQSVKHLDDILSSPELVLRPKEAIDIRFFSRH